MQKDVYGKYNVDRLYIKRKEGAKGLSIIEGCIVFTIKRLKECTRQTDEKLFTIQTEKTLKVTERWAENKKK